MKICIAYVEEPPFYWTAEDGADIELADAVLRAIGVADIECVPTSFDEFLPGVQARRRDMNPPIFVKFGITHTEIDAVLPKAGR